MGEADGVLFALVVSKDDLAAALAESDPMLPAIVFSKAEIGALMADVEKRGLSLPSGEERRHLRTSYQKIVAARLALLRASPRRGANPTKPPEGPT